MWHHHQKFDVTFHYYIHLIVSLIDFMSIQFTCVTILTMAQQNPPRNAVANIVSTDLANTVSIHDNENGSDIIVKSRRRPYCIATPPNIPPNSAPT